MLVTVRLTRDESSLLVLLRHLSTKAQITPSQWVQPQIFLPAFKLNVSVLSQALEKTFGLVL